MRRNHDPKTAFGIHVQVTSVTSAALEARLDGNAVAEATVEHGKPIQFYVFLGSLDEERLQQVIGLLSELRNQANEVLHQIEKVADWQARVAAATQSEERSA